MKITTHKVINFIQFAVVVPIHNNLRVCVVCAILICQHVVTKKKFICSTGVFFYSLQI